MWKFTDVSEKCTASIFSVGNILFKVRLDGIAQSVYRLGYRLGEPTSQGSIPGKVKKFISSP